MEYMIFQEVTGMGNEDSEFGGDGFCYFDEEDDDR